MFSICFSRKASILVNLSNAKPRKLIPALGERIARVLLQPSKELLVSSSCLTNVDHLIIGIQNVDSRLLAKIDMLRCGIFGGHSQ